MKARSDRPPVVLAERPRCPHCSSHQHRVTRTMKHDEWTDAVRQYRRCKNCDRNFVLILE